MKTFQKFGLVFIALLLAFQFTLGVSEAQTQPTVIEVIGGRTDTPVILKSHFTPLPHGYAIIERVAKYTLWSTRNELISGVNTINKTLVGKAETISTDYTTWGTYQTVSPYYITPSGWKGIFTGYSYSVKDDPNILAVEKVVVTGKGYGKLEGYTEVLHDTVITYKVGAVYETFEGWVYPPR